MSTASIRQDACAAAFTGPGVVIENRDFSGDDTIADVLKFSAATARILDHVTVTGGTENACDANNGSSVTVEGTLELVGGDQAGLVVKGGSTFETEWPGEVAFTPSPSSKTDLLVDDWSDQSTKPSRVVGNFIRSDGQPVRVVFGRWHRPFIFGPSRVVWAWTIGLHLYNPIKSLVRFVLRIPAGMKGPGWL